MADETPLDRFKHALTGASRALAHEPEVEVAWSADAPTVRGKQMRVPLPGRSLPPDQVHLVTLPPSGSDRVTAGVAQQPAQSVEPVDVLRVLSHSSPDMNMGA